MIIPQTKFENLEEMAKSFIGTKVKDVNKEQIGTVLEAWVENGSVIAKTKVLMGHGKGEIVQAVIYREDT